jgi:DNA-binding beta-propeller fold protein YncE
MADSAAAAKRRAIRRIHDSYPAFSSIAVDLRNNEVVVTDENLFQILVYDRLASTPPGTSFSEPKRILGGSNTKIEFQCGLYIDPNSGDIYAVNNDTVDTLVIFTREQRGNSAPASELRTPHGTFGIAVSEQRSELFLSLQHSNSIVVFEKSARNRDVPKRLLQGPNTGIADPHGIALDTKRGLLYTTNHGSFRELSRDAGDITQTGMYQGTFSSASTWPAERRVAGTGKTLPSSITVHAIDAQGDAAPLRLLTGTRTRLNWPTGLAVDETTGELFVANDMGDEILVFAPDAQGDVAPLRVLQGPRTGLKNPTGITLDQSNRELWVANFGNHTATVYKMDASGNTSPLRTIRSGPADLPALMIGNPGAVAYDAKRQEILVPN